MTVIASVTIPDKFLEWFEENKNEKVFLHLTRDDFNTLLIKIWFYNLNIKSLYDEKIRKINQIGDLETDPKKIKGLKGLIDETSEICDEIEKLVYGIWYDDKKEWEKLNL